MQLDASAYYALGVPFALGVAAWDHRACRKRGERGWTASSAISHLSTSMGEVLLGLFLAPFLFWIYGFALTHFALVRWAPGSVAPWVLAFLLGDLCYYLNHRAGHRVGLLWAVHSVHHQSDEFHLAIALRHPWLSDVFAWPFYAPLPFLGVPPEHFFLAISAISYYSLSIHSHTFAWHGLWAFVTPRTHQLHHCQNRPYVGQNMGAMFTLWDRAFGTHRDPDPAIPPRFGTARGYQTHNGARAQWLPMRELLWVAARAPSWRERAKVVLGPPGYLPPGVTLPAPSVASRDDEIPLRVRVYAVSQFVIASVFALWILWFRDHHSWRLRALGTLWLMCTLYTLGALLDQTPRAKSLERARIALTALLLVGWYLSAHLRF
ncbi:MAG: sterol desaturase family protein [Deltaproteobacteria bacterium]|nr:sterol desaturase family protein [Deltaproteobacteria bacterium]